MVMPKDYKQYIETFTSISQAIHSGDNPEEIIQAIVDRLADLMEAQGCIFWLLNSEEETIVTKVVNGFAYHNLLGVEYQALAGIFKLNPGEWTCIEDARYEDKIPTLDRIGKRWVISVYGYTLDIASPYAGMLALYYSRSRQLTPDETGFLAALAQQGAIALHKALRYDERLLSTFCQTVEGLVLAIEAKDPLTHGHSVRVAHLARYTAQTMGLSPKQVEKVYHGAMLHDIGKIGMTDRVLNRLGALSAKERRVIREHPVIGARIIEPLVFLNDLIPLILHHHERWDGSGYPDHLEGEAIPLGARILAACDAFETMLTGRPRIPCLPFKEAVARLQSQAGTQFDPRVTGALIESLTRHPEVLTPFGSPEHLLKLLSLGDDASKEKPVPDIFSFFNLGNL